jgi:hypothetical protein
MQIIPILNNLRGLPIIFPPIIFPPIIFLPIIFPPIIFPWTPNFQKLQRRVPTSMRRETMKSSRRIKRCSAKLSLQSNQKSRNKGE